MPVSPLTNDPVDFITQQVGWMGKNASVSFYPVASLAPETIKGTMAVGDRRFEVITSAPKAVGNVHPTPSIAIGHVGSGNWLYFNAGTNAAGQADYLSDRASVVGVKAFSSWLKHDAGQAVPIPSRGAVPNLPSTSTPAPSHPVARP